MTKAETEIHREEYHALISKARCAEQEGLYREALDLALSSWDHIDGMMQYERKYDNREFVNVEGIDLVLKYAPFLFDFQSLDRLEALLKTQRRIERNTSEDLSDDLSMARTLMWETHRLWNLLEQNSEWRQDELRPALGGDQDRWRSMSETWEKMGLIRRTPDGRSHRLALYTQMRAAILAKCPSCGAVVKAAKAKLLESVLCPNCRQRVLFVLLLRDPSTSK